jgi:hypothetical protein
MTQPISCTAIVFMLLSIPCHATPAIAPIKLPAEKTAVAPLPIVLPLALFGLWRIGHRSGVTAADVRRKIPGDSIVHNANWVINRSAILNAPVDEVWPWLLQLGKNRAGWYAPNWLENTLNSHAIRKINPDYEQVKQGDILDDWGPGYQRVIQVIPPYLLLVDEVKKNKKPNPGQPEITEMDISIATVLEAVDSMHTKIIFRLRSRLSWAAYLPARLFGGIADFTFFNTMVAGLNERLRQGQLLQNKPQVQPLN